MYHVVKLLKLSWNTNAWLDPNTPTIGTRDDCKMGLLILQLLCTNRLWNSMIVQFTLKMIVTLAFCCRTLQTSRQNGCFSTLLLNWFIKVSLNIYQLSWHWLLNYLWNVNQFDHISRPLNYQQYESLHHHYKTLTDLSVKFLP